MVLSKAQSFGSVNWKPVVLLRSFGKLRSLESLSSHWSDELGEELDGMGQKKSVSQ